MLSLFVYFPDYDTQFWLYRLNKTLFGYELQAMLTELQDEQTEK